MSVEIQPADPFRIPDEDFRPTTSLPRQYVGYGGMLRRIAAFLIDYLVLLALCSGLGFLLERVGRQAQMTPEAISGLVAMSWLLLGAVYFASMESSAAQGTVGKLAVGLRVTDRRGQPIGFARAVGRYFAKLGSVIFLGVGFLLAPFTERRQALHDLLAGTLVVQLR